MVIVSFLSALLAGMGVGSGGFLVVWLTLFMSVPQLEAQLINMIFFAASSVSSLGVSLFKGRLCLPVIIAVAVPGCLGAASGAFFAHSVEDGLLSKMFGVVLAIMGAITLVKNLPRGKK